jgi:hypothetical protein
VYHVVEKSIASTRREEATVHHVVDDFFDFLREKWLRAWMRAKKKKGKKNGCASTCPQFPVSRFDEIAEIWVAVVARRKVT